MEENVEEKPVKREGRWEMRKQQATQTQSFLTKETYRDVSSVIHWDSEHKDKD